MALQRGLRSKFLFKAGRVLSFLIHQLFDLMNFFFLSFFILFGFLQNIDRKLRLVERMDRTMVSNFTFEELYFSFLFLLLKLYIVLKLIFLEFSHIYLSSCMNTIALVESAFILVFQLLLLSFPVFLHFLEQFFLFLKCLNNILGFFDMLGSFLVPILYLINSFLQNFTLLFASLLSSFVLKLLLDLLLLLSFQLGQFMYSCRIYFMLFDHLSDSFPVLFRLLCKFWHFFEFKFGWRQCTIGQLLAYERLILFYYSQLINHHLLFPQ